MQRISRRLIHTSLLFIAMTVLSCSSESGGISDPGGASLGVGSLVGTVTAAGAPLEGALVSTVPPSTSDSTDAVGHYSLDGVMAQTFVVSVSKAGFITSHKTASVIAGRTFSLDFDLTPSSALGKLEGTITDGNIPLERVSVATTPSTVNIITAGDGRYDIDNVAEGQYRVDAYRVGFFPGRVYLQARAGETTVGDISLGRRHDGVVDGRVLDTAGNPVADALVTLLWDFDALYYTTASDGYFSFSNLTTGYYVISAQSTGYFPGSRSIEAWGGIPVNGTVVLSLTSASTPLPGAIAGTVWDSDYSAIDGAVVTLDSTGPSPSSTVTGTDGRYFFTDVSTGAHTVSAGRTGYVTCTTNVSVASSVTADASFTLKTSI